MVFGLGNVGTAAAGGHDWSKLVGEELEGHHSGAQIEGVSTKHGSIVGG